MISCLLTVLTFGLISMSLVALQYFMMHGQTTGFTKIWTHGTLIAFLVVIVSMIFTVIINRFYYTYKSQNEYIAYKYNVFL